MFGWHDSSILPTPLAELHPEFVSNFGRPLGLWAPCDGPEHKAYDLAGNDAKNPGALNGGITTVPGGFGTLGAAWKFASSEIAWSNSAAADVSIGDFTFSFVAQIPSAGSLQVIWDKRLTSSPNTGTTLYFASSGALNIQLNSSAVHAFTPGWSTDGKTHLFCVVVSRSTNSLLLYVDGLLISTTGISAVIGSLSNSNMLVVGQSNTGTFPFSGSLSVFALSPSAFSAAQVSTLYSCLLTGEPFPLFAPSPLERAYGYAARGGGGAAKPPPPELLYGRAA